MFRTPLAALVAVALMQISAVIADAPAKDTAINDVPCIATYYVQPTVTTAQKVRIDYRVSDFHDSNYLRDESHTFTIDCWVNGSKTTLKGVTSGDRTITLDPLPAGDVLLALQATDERGRKSQRLFQEFRVVEPGHDRIPKDQILTPDLAQFGIHNDDTHPVETTAGLTKMLRWAAEKGYRKVVLPKGTYRIDENATVQMASGLTLDMNGSVFRLNPNALGKGLMFEMVDCVDSHVTNGTFEGDLHHHNFKDAPHNSEWLTAVSLGHDTRYCTFENVTLRNITGYGSATTIGGGGARRYSHDGPQNIAPFTPGDIDAQGQDVASEVRTTSPLVDIAAFMKSYGFVQFGVYLGYQGNPAGRWDYKASFYDADKKFIETIQGHLYRRLYPPKEARFVRLTLFSKATPKNFTLFNFRAPYNCGFIRVRHENIRCVGMTPSGFSNLLVEGCTFAHCGWAAARCAFDAEDGWDLMQDLTFRKNTFDGNPANEFLTCGGHNFVMTENTMRVYMWDRTHDAVFRNNRIGGATFRFAWHDRTGNPQIRDNVFTKRVNLILVSSMPFTDYCVRDSVCEAGVSFRQEKKAKQDHDAYFYKCTITPPVDARTVDCTIVKVPVPAGK